MKNTQKNKLQPLNKSGIQQRIVENAGREGKFAFAPTAMAIALVNAAVA